MLYIMWNDNVIPWWLIWMLHILNEWLIDVTMNHGRDYWHDDSHDDEWMFIDCTLKCWNKWINEIVLCLSEIKILSLSKRSTILHWHGASCPSLWMSLCHNGARQGTLICWLKNRGRAWGVRRQSTQMSSRCSSHSQPDNTDWHPIVV